MSQLILHHYPMSPFSQKVRSMLGYAGLSWQSVQVREFPPRPHLQALAGGYRKIPVAQIGADIFCDSHLIAEEVAALSARPELRADAGDQAQQDWIRRVDYDLFFACVLAAGNKTLRRKAWDSMSLLDLLRFAVDRLGMGRSSRLPVVGLREARPIVQAHAADIESRLQQDFLFGSTPVHADFSTYHGLWMIHTLAQSSQFKAYPRLLAWLERMQAFGEGQSQPLSIAQALAAARDAEPRALDAGQLEHALLGQMVAIAPDDYGREASRGRLVGVTATRWVLARDTAGLGRVHVHFPRRGFELQPG